MATNIYDNANRYSARESHIKDSNRAKVVPGGVYNSTMELYPNVVRIEPLGYNARQAYLGTLHGMVDAMKFAMAEQMNPDSFKPFYGILTPSSMQNLGFTFTSTWSPAGNTFDQMASILSSPAMAVPFMANTGEAIGKAAGHGDGGFVAGASAGALASAYSALFKSDNSGPGDKKGGLFNRALHAISAASMNIGNFLGAEGDGLGNLYGMDNSSTGSSTLQVFKGASFSPIDRVTVSWYMPEQEDLFRMSLRRLLQLGYVRSLVAGDTNDSLVNRIKAATKAAARESFIGMGNVAKNSAIIADSIADTGKAFTDTVDSVAGMVGSESLTEAVSGVEGAVDEVASRSKDMAKNGIDTIIKNGEDYANTGHLDSDKKDTLIEKSSDLITKLLDTYMKGNEFIGVNFTLIPNPVRVTIGNILDMEPLVISQINITNSEETFINDIGAHIPVTVTATISFKSWLTPGPNHDFMRYLGDNPFYTHACDNSSNQSKKGSR